MGANLKDVAHRSIRETALSGLETTLRIAKDASNNAGIPRLAAGIGGLAVILEAVQQMSNNTEDAERLIQCVTVLDTMLRGIMQEETLPQPILSRVLGLLKQWEVEGDKVKKFQSCSRFRRFLGAKADTKVVASHLDTINQSISDFMLESTTLTEICLHALRRDIKSLLGTLNLPHSKAAHFDYSYNNVNRMGCMDGTRTEILQKLYIWIKSDPDFAVFYSPPHSPGGFRWIPVECRRTSNKRI